MTPLDGLTSVEAELQQRRGLHNQVAQKTSRSLAHILRSNVLTRFNALLGTLFLLVIFAGSPTDALFGIVLVVNTFFGTVQEWKAKRTLDRIRILHAPTIAVMRDGKERRTAVSDIVQNDIVILRAGDQIPVDGYVILSDNLEVNESNLTGEADAAHKLVGDRVLSGTYVVAGSGYIRALAVGKSAYAHQLATEAQRYVPTSSEIFASINRLLLWTLWVIVFLAPIHFWTQIRVFGSQNWQEATIRSVAGLVGIIPEGLVVLTTLTFLTSAVRLSQQQVLVQQLPAVETLARVNVVCIDKTGTLTTGEMTCQTVQYFQPEDENVASHACAALANDPSANQTLEAIARHFSSTSPMRIVSQIPFQSQRKWKAINTEHNGSWYLGAPDKLVAPDHNILETVTQRAQQGQRVLLLAHSSQHVIDEELPLDIRPVALIEIEEQIRPDAADTVAYFKAQGVELYVLSGDHVATVTAIAHKIGIDATHVFGRVTPEQKRQFVLDRQAQNDVVAMTGDGVNDVLALKSADIGIAMNNAAPATKSVAELILLDGQFSHLPHVIAEGRRVIGNVERVAHIFVTKNVMSVFAILSVAILSRPFPFLPRQMTLLSSLAVGIPGFFLALGHSSQRYLSGFLQRVATFSLPVGIFAGVGIVSVDFVDQQEMGTSALVAALIIFFFITSRFIHPWSLVRIVWMISLIALATGAVLVPASADFLSLHNTNENLLYGITMGIAVSAVVSTWQRRSLSTTTPRVSH